MKQVIDYEGRLNEKCGKYQGLKVAEARNTIVEDLKAAGMMVKIDENYQHVIGLCYRCKTVIEPLPYQQWFIKVKDLAAKAKAAVEKGHTKFAAEKFEKIYNHWLDNLRDWNISRQIVWGIQIPAWYCRDCNKWTITAGEVPEKCKYCGSKNIERDKDTFDTWFSSGQWPFATLQTTKPGDFDRFYPTSIMETAYDILPFWVMRMMMMGLYLTNQTPFKKVYLHGLVRDEKGQKMSKSKGNAINPIDLIDKYGTDALRLALVMSTTAGHDSAVGETKVRGMRNLSNKIWNAARFIKIKREYPNTKLQETNINQKDLVYKQKLNEIIDMVTKQLDDLKIGLAAETVHNEFWHWFCDEVLESNKKLATSDSFLEKGMRTFLKLLHPFMPFVTEVVWKELEYEGLLIKAEWPTTDK